MTKRREHRSGVSTAGESLPPPPTVPLFEPRFHPYTIEGYLQQLGDVAAATNRARGWRRTVAKLGVVAVIVGTLVPVGRTVGTWVFGVTAG